MTAVTPGAVVLATHNVGKIAELRRILAEANAAVELVGMDAFPSIPEVAETGASFAENALLKARAIASATGQVAVADDSGLCVDALNGMPGIFSARWAGQHGDDRANLELLLGQLTDVPDPRRTAHFTCAAAIARPDGSHDVVEGHLPGVIIRAPRGDQGFGYDPIFMPVGETRTTAQLSPAEKDAISHRGIAFRLLAPLISVLG